MIASTQQSTVFRIVGMDCPDEIAKLRESLRGVNGIGALSFNLMRATMTVNHDASCVNQQEIIECVRKTGMRATIAEARSSPLHLATSPSRGPLTMTVLATVGIVLGLAFSFLPTSQFHHTTWPAAIAYMLAIAAAWRYVLPKALGALLRLKLDMNVLMTIAVIGALSLGEWLEASTVAFLFMISHLLETWSVNRARRAVQSLMELTPPRARVIRADGAEEDQDVERVAVGTSVVVRPGEKFPLDGKIVTGETSVNQAPITGESALISKSPGDEVFAGTINQDGAVTVAVTKPAGDSVLAGIIRLVEQAQSKRSRTEQFVDRFAHYYTPTVVAIALALCVMPPLLFKADWSTWFYRSLILLVIACPCALVISTPVSVVSSLAAAARNGVLIKGGEYLEAAGQARVLAIDKTGTLTMGSPVVEKVIPLGGTPADRVLEIAAAIEQRSEHPIGKVIVGYAASRGILPPACQTYQAIRGKGARATVNGEEYFLGNHRLLEENNLCTEEIHLAMTEHEDCHHTAIGLASAHAPLGVILLADALRDETPQAIQALRQNGVEQIIMLTGDNAGTAKAIALQCGGIQYRAELLPADKVAVVDELRRRFKHVIMVGDGINDAPALAAATIGIAMGAGGSDAAIETADIALMTDDLRKLPWLIRHSRRTRNIIIQNISLSLSIKVVFLALAILGIANLWMAIAADTGASLLVTFNGLRLLRVGTADDETQSCGTPPKTTTGIAK